MLWHPVCSAATQQEDDRSKIAAAFPALSKPMACLLFICMFPSEATCSHQKLRIPLSETNLVTYISDNVLLKVFNRLLFERALEGIQTTRVMKGRRTLDPTMRRRVLTGGAHLDMDPVHGVADILEHALVGHEQISIFEASLTTTNGEGGRHLDQ